MKLMIIAFSIFGLFIITLIVVKIDLSIKFGKQVEELFSQSKDISDKKFKHEQLIGLPPPVQRYFAHVLKEGQSYISYVRLTHDGEFKTGQDKDWVNIKGEQYFTAEKPGFIWKGTTSMFTARDMYIADKGRLVVTLGSLINIVDGRGEEYNQGELLRWLGECVWFPTNLLPSEKLQWFPIDTETAKLTLKYNGLSLFYIATFNTVGEIIQLETKRYMDNKNLETWIIKLANYKQMSEIVVPTTFEVLWRLERGDLSYAKFNLKNIEYNKPVKF